MAMTYDALTAAKTNPGSIAYRLNWSLLPIEDVMEDAQAFIYGNLRTREMRASATLTIALNASSVALPSGFLDPLGLFDERGDEIHLWDERNLTKKRRFDSAGALTVGRVSVYGIFNEAVNFDVRSNKAVSYTMLYYKRPDNLGPSNQTNWLTTRYPNVLRAALMAYAYDARKEELEFRTYLAQAVALIQAANEEADLSRRGSDFPVENL